MEKVFRKISYIEGLIEGIDLKDSSKEGKIISELIQLCNFMAKEMEQIKLQVEDQEIYLESIDEDLADIEEILFEELDDIDEDDLDSVGMDDNDNYYEITCPHCKEMVLVDQGIYDDDYEVEVRCPECQKIIVINEEEPIISRHLYDIGESKGEIHYYSP